MVHQYVTGRVLGPSFGDLFAMIEFLEPNCGIHRTLAVTLAAADGRFAFDVLEIADPGSQSWPDSAFLRTTVATVDGPRTFSTALPADGGGGCIEVTLQIPNGWLPARHDRPAPGTPHSSQATDPAKLDAMPAAGAFLSEWLRGLT